MRKSRYEREYLNGYAQVKKSGDKLIILSDGAGVIDEKTVITADDRYGIRYSEALCIEAAYQRRRADRLETRMLELEKKLSELESKIS